MTVLRTTALIDAPAGAVREVLEDYGAMRMRLLGRSFPVRTELTETGAGTLLTCSLSWNRLGPVLDPLLCRRRVLTRLTALTVDVRSRADRGGCC